VIKAVILGCGPAGLLAAHAINLLGKADITIYSRKVKSPMAGAQFIHREIPGIKVPGTSVRFVHTGTESGYAMKVYGNYRHECSWDHYPEGLVPCWPMRAIYEVLWERWEDRVVDAEVTSALLDDIEVGEADILISSIPAPVLCQDEAHEFLSAKVWIKQVERQVLGNVIVYNGDMDALWYRESQMFGMHSLEYSELVPHEFRPEGCVKISKPQSTNCTCRPEWKRVGRYGKWQRGVLVHESYEEVSSAVHPLFA
jgi:hypothetical protein